VGHPTVWYRRKFDHGLRFADIERLPAGVRALCDWRYGDYGGAITGSGAWYGGELIQVGVARPALGGGVRRGNGANARHTQRTATLWRQCVEGRAAADLGVFCSDGTTG